MMDPYRDQERQCPACKETLREYQDRLVCDGCYGMLLTLPDLGAAIYDLTSVTPTFEFKDEAPGKRECPRCRELMTTCKLRLMLDKEIEEPRPELDRCAAHGLWFDGEELVKVFEKVTGKGFGGGLHPKPTPGKRGLKSDGSWSAMFPKAGGGGGWGHGGW